MAAKIKEYWVIDRFERTMTIFTMRGGRIVRRVIRQNQIYKTKLLPGFELPLRRLLELADYWAKKRRS
jgi:Uma2 family endonuclease